MSVRDELQEIFRDVFEDSSLLVFDEMTAADVERWDSLEHINLIIASENSFNIKFTIAEMSRLREPGQNVGSFIKLIESKVSR